MKKSLLIITLLLLVVSCSNEKVTQSIVVTTPEELINAAKNAQPGDDIVIKNGTYKDVEIEFVGEGTKENPINLRAETPGQVYIEGVSNLEIAGSYLNVSGLYFRNGYTPTKDVIAFRTGSEKVANYSTVSNCVILDFNQEQRDKDDLWVQFYGTHNALKNCYLAGKTNGGPTVRVDLKGNQSIRNYHQIVNNHFGPRPRKGGARGETIQLGSSFTSMSPSNTTIANNLFEECNGEVEIISSKTNFNIIRNNVFYKSEGSVVTRHGNYATIDGNYFIGDGVNKNYGGIRIVNTGHWIINNYFYKIIGENFRSPLAVMNGIPKSPLNRYNQVTDVVVAYNTYVDSKSPWQFGVGTNIAQADVLPKSEIRSARALRTVVANNVIYNTKGDKDIIIEHDKADGVKFKSNIINNQGVDFGNEERITPASFELTKVSENIYLPKLTEDFDIYNGFGFETIKKDLFGNSRLSSNSIGATVKGEFPDPNILDKTKYGAEWFSNVVEAKEPTVIEVASESELEAKITAANAGDIIALSAGKYTVSKSIVINKTITIQSKGNEKAEIVFTGGDNTALFELNPYGILNIKNVVLKGNGKQQAFSNLKEKMSNHFGLTVVGCEVDNFDYVLKAYKQTFAEEITFKDSKILNCENGIELSEETNDKGDYNTEYLTIENCDFVNVKQNVIDYYRGGYDESTIGGNLLVANSTFTNCGSKEKNGILLNHRGIVNVNITKNTFKNNRVQFVSILWGAKNNIESENTLVNSGKIKTEENLKLKLMY
ncbi:chondroitinase-B domain-containing protein [Polaribacter sargassicola]|uniref:chondroitinase-B domain-containing protein n=1 Tax=Polaribacter sargassicola TaxID=2836891 RepID=UPI001F2A3DF8|nr:chondroitinase-B domain-containing protein [Polaribacter sp. DS7-9]MCG1037384.1 polysaccharide lyase 6 family protein [Polaribacter sp. DS7-9]